MKRLKLYWLNFRRFWYTKTARIVEMEVSGGLPFSNCANGKVPVGPVWNCIFQLPTIFLFFAATVGCYCRYWHYRDFLTLSIMGVSGVLLVVSILLLRIFRKSSALDPIGHLWLGCGIGLVALLNPEVPGDIPIGAEYLINILMLGSLGLQFLLEFANQLCCIASSSKSREENLTREKKPPGLFTSNEMFEIAGLIISCLALPDEIFWIFIALLSSFLACVLAIRLRSYMALGILAFLVSTAYVYTFPSVSHLVTVHPVALVTLSGRLLISGVISLVISNGIDRLSVWRNWLTARKLWQIAALSVLFGIFTIFYALHADSVKSHREWLIVTPLFAVVSVFWLLSHFVFIAVLWELVNRLADCQSLLVTGTEAELRKVLAAKGLRYFSLVALRLGYFAIVSSGLIGVLCAAVRNGYNFSILSIVLTLELLLTELFNEFTTGLGGTCLGYAIVTPVANLR